MTLRVGQIITAMRFTAPGAEPEEDIVVHHVHTAAEIGRMLEAAGFAVEQLLGDPRERTPFELWFAEAGGGRESVLKPLRERDCNI